MTPPNKPQFDEHAPIFDLYKNSSDHEKLDIITRVQLPRVVEQIAWLKDEVRKDTKELRADIRDFRIETAENFDVVNIRLDIISGTLAKVSATQNGLLVINLLVLLFMGFIAMVLMK